LRVIAATVILLLGQQYPSWMQGLYQYEGEKGKLSFAGVSRRKGHLCPGPRFPEENPSAELGLELKASTSTWLSSKLLVQAVDDGKVIDPGNGRLVNDFSHIYQDKNPYVNFDEAFLDIYTGKVDFRLGIQKFAWGRLDEINPTDNLNTEDLTEGGMNDEIERKIGVPSAKVNLYSDLLNVELGWVPRFVPYRLPTSEERWFPRVLQPPSVITAGHSGRYPCDDCV